MLLIATLRSLPPLKTLSRISSRIHQILNRKIIIAVKIELFDHKRNKGLGILYDTNLVEGKEKARLEISKAETHIETRSDFKREEYDFKEIGEEEFLFRLGFGFPLGEDEDGD